MMCWKFYADIDVDLIVFSFGSIVSAFTPIGFGEQHDPAPLSVPPLSRI